jgi:hypothetical protein
MFNIHEMATMWSMQTLGSFGLLNSDSEVLLVFVSGLTDGQSCQAIYSFLRGVYINVGEILNSDWLKSYSHWPNEVSGTLWCFEKKGNVVVHQFVSQNFLLFYIFTDRLGRRVWKINVTF